MCGAAPIGNHAPRTTLAKLPHGRAIRYTLHAGHTVQDGVLDAPTERTVSRLHAYTAGHHGHPLHQFDHSHPSVSSAVSRLISNLHDHRRSSSRLDQTLDGDPKKDVARARGTRLREESVASGHMASLDAQGSLVARIFGCWLVRALASRALRVSVSPKIAGSHRSPETLKCPCPSRPIKSGSNQHGSWTSCPKRPVRGHQQSEFNGIGEGRRHW